MSRGKIAYNIMAVRERNTIVDSIVKGLPSDNVTVFFDDLHKGCAWNAMRAWKAGEAEYTCVLQDDIEIADNFCDAANIVSMLFPDSIIAFYNQGLTFADFDGATYGILPTCAISGPAIMMPRRIASDFVHFFDSYLGDGYNFDDAAIRMFAILNGIQTITMCPSIVRCIDGVRSTFGSSHSQKNTLVWCGGHIDIAKILKPQTKILKPISMPTHLPVGHKLRIAVEKRIAMKKKVYC